MSSTITMQDDFDQDSLAGVSTTTESHQQSHLNQPILVGYAFGPKKMETMSVVMAEASKAKLSTVISEAALQSQQKDTVSPSSSNKTLTFAALEERASPQTDVEFSIAGGPTGTGLRNIVRYFRSSCSSVATDDDNTSTTASATTFSANRSTTSSSLQPQEAGADNNTAGALSTTRSTASSSHLHPVRVSFVPLDLDSPLDEQHGGRFDVILHKMTEDILRLSTADQQCKGLMEQENADCKRLDNETEDQQLQQALRRIRRLDQYHKNHPHCSLVDHPSRVQVVMSRLEIANLLERSLVGVSSTSGLCVCTPKFTEYTSTSSRTHENLQYPLIAKPLTAAGTKKSHCMGIVLSPRGLSRVETPCLLQEYANHDAHLFKVYVLGEHVHVFSRPSLPNLPRSKNELDALQHCYVEFDSQRPYPKLVDFGIGNDKHDDDCMPPPPRKRANLLILTQDEIAPVVTALKQAFGLELFGFDILVSSTQPQELLVVDVNYFPSYKEVQYFPSLLAKYLTQRAIQGRKQVSQANNNNPGSTSIR